MIKKMEHFVASLTDQEIDCQLKDILSGHEFTRNYLKQNNLIDEET